MILGVNVPLLTAIAILGIAGNGFAEPSEKEIVALMNKAQRAVAEGNVKSHDELTNHADQICPLSVSDRCGSRSGSQSSAV